MILLLLALFAQIEGPKSVPANTPIVLNVKGWNAALVYPTYIPLPIINNQVNYTPVNQEIHVFAVNESTKLGFYFFPVSILPTINEPRYSVIVFDINNPYVVKDPNIFNQAKTLNTELRVWPSTNPMINTLNLNKYVKTLPTIITYTKSGKVYPIPATIPDDLLKYYNELYSRP